MGKLKLFCLIFLSPIILAAKEFEDRIGNDPEIPTISKYSDVQKVSDHLLKNSTYDFTQIEKKFVLKTSVGIEDFPICTVGLEVTENKKHLRFFVISLINTIDNRYIYYKMYDEDFDGAIDEAFKTNDDFGKKDFYQIPVKFAYYLGQPEFENCVNNYLEVYMTSPNVEMEVLE